MHDKTEKTVINLVIGLFFMTVWFLPYKSEAASAKRNIREGNALYEEGDYEGSKEKYLRALTKDPESDIINFNLGSALYKDKEYERSIEHFQKAFLSEDALLKEKAYYNVGNSFYQLGLAQENEHIEQAVSSLQKSIKQYERALEIDKEDEDTHHNYAFVDGELRRSK